MPIATVTTKTGDIDKRMQGQPQNYWLQQNGMNNDID